MNNPTIPLTKRPSRLEIHEAKKAMDPESYFQFLLDLRALDVKDLAARQNLPLDVCEKIVRDVERIHC